MLLCRLLHEDWAGGKGNFELDHFRPKGRDEFRHLIQHFYNLYYSCHVCNRNKRDQWPIDEELAKGVCFVDLCRDDWEQHYELLPNGRLAPLTTAAEYTIDTVRLNSEHLVRLRGWAVREKRDLDSERI
jgi:hypothetical protein